MATVMHMHWPGVTPDQYEQVRRSVDWEGDLPDGAKLHVAGFDGDGITVLDVWESEEKFGAFQEQRLAPAVQEAGIEGPPDVRFYPLHGIFAPALGKSEQVSDI
ncbi:MAG: hypothetical protein QOK31_625 [Solirubrobacteraceae bacterium]|jgi:hypothetical protein|nr:hypothetical protein [Solirubrobacteraceae bacterium]